MLLLLLAACSCTAPAEDTAPEDLAATPDPAADDLDTLRARSESKIGGRVVDALPRLVLMEVPLEGLPQFESELLNGDAEVTLIPGDFLPLPDNCPQCGERTGQDWSERTEATLRLTGVAAMTLQVVDRHGNVVARAFGEDNVVDLRLEGGPGWSYRAPGSDGTFTDDLGFALLTGFGEGVEDLPTQVTMEWR